ncbi:NUDIX hydrolase [Abyssicoccus albus]|uniref:ADP-ribose pyrophosphatase n=1 Tax=Abyssicoccus albus TaxID=1817405 RepID=A0A1Q1G198_9BACL|nr:NUDIX hydrolase [Abyssicoccus albus]AQL56128.1 hypothetical protein BVH56_03935 [Abyssicoccus albus]RPF58056.1 ADP-ribose pyrophosphatase [Abyssicoccus albus]
MGNSEKKLYETTEFKGRIIEVKKSEVLLPNGKKANREVVYHPGAVAILAINERQEVIFVKQYRLSVDQELLEIPAGKIEQNEQPIDCAKRELMEETGYSSNDLRLIADVYVSPGITDERLYIYHAQNISEQTNQSLDSDEFVTLEYLTVEKIQEGLENLTFNDAKTVIALQYYLNTLDDE